MCTTGAFPFKGAISNILMFDSVSNTLYTAPHLHLTCFTLVTVARRGIYASWKACEVSRVCTLPFKGEMCHHLFKSATK